MGLQFNNQGRKSFFEKIIYLGIFFTTVTISENKYFTFGVNFYPHWLLKGRPWMQAVTVSFTIKWDLKPL